MEYLVTARDIVDDISMRKALKESIHNTVFGKISSSMQSRIIGFMKVINKARMRNSYYYYIETGYSEISKEFKEEYSEVFNFLDLLGFKTSYFVDDSDYRHGDVVKIKIDWSEGCQPKSEEAVGLVKLLLEVYENANFD